jgi:hypothetical protein
MDDIAKKKKKKRKKEISQKCIIHLFGNATFFVI